MPVKLQKTPLFFVFLHPQPISHLVKDTVKNIAVLGATGSIGSQTLDIIASRPGRYHAVVLTAGSNAAKLIEAARVHRPRRVVIGRTELLPQVEAALAPLGIECRAGDEALAECVEADDIDTVVTATVGYSGLQPTVRAIRAGKDIALANKETLVVAGDMINRMLVESSSKIYPVDSEHSAIAQCLAGEKPDRVRRLLITASGGPFRTWSAERMAEATAADALRHPNWSMGRKITVDSATMMNKAFEIIEAHYLFGVAPDRIEAVVHPQSIVHSMVEFVDGAVKAQLGLPDMHLPIAYALGCHSRLEGASQRMGLADFATLTFEKPDEERFPCLGLARVALGRRGNTACVINAANEIAVAAFLEGRIKFGRIYGVIERTLDAVSYVAAPEFDDYVASNAEARAKAAEMIK